MGGGNAEETGGGVEDTSSGGLVLVETVGGKENESCTCGSRKESAFDVKAGVWRDLTRTSVNNAGSGA